MTPRPPGLTGVEEAGGSQQLRPYHSSQRPIVKGGQPQLLGAHLREGRPCRWGGPGPLLLLHQRMELA